MSEPKASPELLNALDHLMNRKPTTPDPNAAPQGERERAEQRAVASVIGKYIRRDLFDVDLIAAKVVSVLAALRPAAAPSEAETAHKALDVFGIARAHESGEYEFTLTERIQRLAHRGAAAALPPTLGVPVAEAIRILSEKPPLILAGDDATDVAGWFDDRARRAIAALRTAPAAPSEPVQTDLPMHPGPGASLADEVEALMAWSDARFMRPVRVTYKMLERIFAALRSPVQSEPRKEVLVGTWRPSGKYQMWECPSCGSLCGSGVSFCHGQLLDEEDGGNTLHVPVFRPAAEARQGSEPPSDTSFT